MKEYIKPVSPIYGATCSYVNSFELLDKVNEIIEYLNGVISVGLLPIPEGYKEEGKEASLPVPPDKWETPLG